MYKYKWYEVYECSQIPTEHGKYIGKTPILEQALTACEKAKECGLFYFIYGIKADGSKVIFL